MHSIKTDAVDLVSLSSSAFHIVKDESPDASTVVLLASISSNECSSLEAANALRAFDAHVRTCGLSGGECAPRPDLGFSRQCRCPPG